MQTISDKVIAEDKIQMYIKLAEFHSPRALEILVLAESELSNLETPWDKLEAVDYLSDAYMKHQATEQYRALIPIYDQGLKEIVNVMNTIRIVSLFILQAGADLIEKNQADYEKNVKAAQEALFQFKEEGLFREYAEKLEKLAEKTDEVFGIDQLELHARKV